VAPVFPRSSNVGLVSENLTIDTRKIIGVDTSQAMVDVFNQKAISNATTESMHALCLDITTTTDIPAELGDIDVVVCALSYHHIGDIDHISKILASLLNKGGHLLVVDLLESLFLDMSLILDDVSSRFHGKHGHGHGHGHGDGHQEHSVLHDGRQLSKEEHDSVISGVAHLGGFSLERIQCAFKATGLLGDISAKQAFTMEKDGIDFAFLVASGKRV
jgi:SAM-dependent methyltransferase